MREACIADGSRCVIWSSSPSPNTRCTSDFWQSCNTALRSTRLNPDQGPRLRPPCCAGFRSTSTPPPTAESRHLSQLLFTDRYRNTLPRSVRPSKMDMDMTVSPQTYMWSGCRGNPAGPACNGASEPPSCIGAVVESLGSPACMHGFMLGWRKCQAARLVSGS